jgi:hypothetical protein
LELEMTQLKNNASAYAPAMPSYFHGGRIIFRVTD